MSSSAKDFDNGGDSEFGQRKIIHVDMDAFYASVEQRDFPEYRGRAVVVGGKPDSRGVVAACSYEARAFGIHSAMPSSQAYRCCPEAVFLPPRFDVYRQVSQQVQSIFRRYSELVEPLSLDEAYIDVTGSTFHSGSATRIAESIRHAIFDQTALTASAGISYNKFLAKLASDMNKPNGQFVILPSQAEALLESLAIRKFHGIGKATEAKMHLDGIHSGRDLKSWRLSDLQSRYGKAGSYYYEIVRGRDHRRVSNNRKRKSIGAETTFAADMYDFADLQATLAMLTEKIVKVLNHKQFQARTVTLKVKYDNFQQVTRSYSLAQGVSEMFHTVEPILALLPELLAKTEAGKRKVRLLGVSLSNLKAIEAENKSPAGRSKSKLDQPTVSVGLTDGAGRDREGIDNIGLNRGVQIPLID